MQRRSGCIAWLVIAAAIVVFFLIWQYVDYRLTSRTLPAGMTVAGLSVEGMTQEQALNALDVAFATPLEVTYRDQVLSLSPSAVELRYEAGQTAANLDAALADWRGIEGFIAHVLRRTPDPMDVPAAISYSGERLDAFLTRTAKQFDRSSQEPVVLPASLAFRPGQAGSKLVVEASRARLADTLVSAAKGRVDLVVETEEAPPMELDLLEGMLQSRLEPHEGLIAGIFVKELRSGDELSINSEVAYTGLGVLKIAILEETYRNLDQPPGARTKRLISETVTQDGNAAANMLLRDVIGSGDSYQGVETLTPSMNRLGLINTFMAAPYDQEDVASTIVTPANSRTDITTAPDPSMQTTPLDGGLLLEMIYQCSRGGGTLKAVYPDDLTVDECEDMIDWLSKNRIDSLIELGVPIGTKVAHKQGLTGDTHADAGIVFSPGGDFVLVIFLHRPQWLEWEESNSLVIDIATATYNYFNPTQ